MIRSFASRDTEELFEGGSRAGSARSRHQRNGSCRCSTAPRIWTTFAI